MKPTRRELGAVGIGTVVGIGGLTTLSTDTAHAQVTGEFTIPEVDKQIVDPINSVRLNVDGTLSWESDTLPTRAILRLEVAQRQDEFAQLDAKSFDTDLTKSHTQSFTFSDANILSHPDIDTSAFMPESSDTISMTLYARLSVTVERNGETLAESELNESIPITIEQTNGETTITMGATGEIQIGTSD